MELIKNIQNYWLLDKPILQSDNMIIGLDNVIKYTDYSINYFKNNLYFFSNNKLYDSSLNLIIEDDAENISFINGYYYSFQRIQNKFRHRFLKNGITHWEICDSSRTINPPEQLIFRQELTTSEIFKRDIETGKTLWAFSVKELGKYSDWEGKHEGKIDGKIFECQGVLIMRITENQLIGIDNKTGKLLWKKQYPPIVFYYGKHNDEFYVMHESFCLLNPLTGKETPRFSFLSVFEKEAVENYCVQLFSDKYMYTIGRWDLNILQWDKQTGEIVWKQELHPKMRKGRHGVTLKGDVVDPVQFANGKLYVLDSMKNLHIFERE